MLCIYLCVNLVDRLLEGMTIIMPALAGCHRNGFWILKYQSRTRASIVSHAFRMSVEYIQTMASHPFLYHLDQIRVSLPSCILHKKMTIIPIVDSSLFVLFSFFFCFFFHLRFVRSLFSPRFPCSNRSSFVLFVCTDRVYCREYGIMLHSMDMRMRKCTVCGLCWMDYV